jgi:hypothetical protein
MPALPAAPGIIKVALDGVFNDTHWTNIFHMKYVGGPPDSEDLVLFDTAQGATMVRPWNHQMHTESTITSVTYTDLTSPTAAVAIVSKDVAGTVDGSGLPANVSALINFPVARRYRGGHSRMYMGGMGQNSTLDQNAWQSSFITNMNNDFAAFIAGLNGYSGTGLYSITVGQLSYYESGTLRDAPLFDPWLAADTQPRICTQRRRLGKTTPVG